MLLNNLLTKLKKSKKTDKAEEHHVKQDELKTDKLSVVGNTDTTTHNNAKKSKINSVVLKTMVATEKTDKALVNNRYVFYVFRDTNKTEIKKEIKKLYGVMPLSVNILNVLGKSVRRGRTIGKKVDRKKAYVTLKKGDSIKI